MVDLKKIRIQIENVNENSIRKFEYNFNQKIQMKIQFENGNKSLFRNWKESLLK